MQTQKYSGREGIKRIRHDQMQKMFRGGAVFFPESESVEPISLSRFVIQTPKPKREKLWFGNSN